MRSGRPTRTGGRQTRLDEFRSVPCVYVDSRSLAERVERRGLSEHVVRRRLEAQGWIVWRSASVGAHKRADVYPSVKRKYELLEATLERERPGTHGEIEYLSRVHHGLPDFFCYRRGVFKFVECKLGHEQLGAHQRRSIARLCELGFPAEVHVLADEGTKARRALIVLGTGERTVSERQRYFRTKPAANGERRTSTKDEHEPGSQLTRSFRAV